MIETLEYARQMMGQNFHGLQEAAQFFGSYSPQQLSALATIPYSTQTVDTCKSSHVLVPGFPHTLLDIRRKIGTELFGTGDATWYNRKSFAETECVSLRWYLVRREVVPNSVSRSYHDQCALLAPEESTMRVAELAHCIALHFLITGERLFEDVFGRCSDRDAAGDQVFLGFPKSGLHIDSDWGGYPEQTIGLASFRRS